MYIYIYDLSQSDTSTATPWSDKRKGYHWYHNMVSRTKSESVVPNASTLTRNNVQTNHFIHDISIPWNIKRVLILDPIEALIFDTRTSLSISFISRLADSSSRRRPKESVSKGIRFLLAADAKAKTTELLSTASQNAICELALDGDCARVQLRVSLGESSKGRLRAVESLN